MRSFAVLNKHGLDFIVGLVDLLARLRSGEHDLSGCENKQDDLRDVHTKDETWKAVGFVATVFRRSVQELFQSDLEADVVRGHDVLHHEL